MPETNHPPEFHGGSFPLMIDLAGKTVLVVGGGAVAARKIRTLVSFGARVRVVSPALSPDVPREQVEHTAREWREEDLGGALLAVAATDRREVNAAVARACRERKILCNVADRPAECGFFSRPSPRRGPSQSESQAAVKAPPWSEGSGAHSN